MDDAMRDLYQDMILGHNKAPRNRGTVPEADARREGHNPLCGDQLVLTARFDGDTIEDIRFDGHGCAIDTASASMMTEAVKGRSTEEARSLAKEFLHLVLRDGEADRQRLGKLAVFTGVGEFPARVKCATLPWRTLEAILDGKDEEVTTE